MKLSACVVAKDQQRHLRRCLMSVRDAVDEIIIADSWGTCKDEAAQFGAAISRFVWNGDLVAARNASMSGATGDWILLMDSDEYLYAGDGPKLRSACENADISDVVALRVRLSCDGGVQGETVAAAGEGDPAQDTVIRLIRRDAGFCFKAPVFEVPVLPDGNPPRALVAPLVTLCRNAADGNEQLEYSSRRVEEFPEHPTAYLLRGLQYKRAGRPLPMMLDFERAFDLRYKASAVGLGTIPPLDDRYPAALCDCGVIWATLGEYRRAIDRFVSAIKAQPAVCSDDFDLHKTLRELAANSVCLPDKEAIAVLSQFASDKNSLARMVNILRSERPDGVFVHFCEKLFNQTHRRDINYITVQMITGEYPAAVSALLSRYRSGGNSTYAYRALVGALLANKPGLVESVENQAVDALLLAYAGRGMIEPFNDAYLETAELMMDMSPDALATMRWMDMGMDSPVLAERLGVILAKCRRFRRAIRSFKRAQLLYEETRPDIQEKLAWCCYRAGLYEDAAGHMEAAVGCGADAMKFELLAHYTAGALPDGGCKQRLLRLIPEVQ